MDKLKIFFYLEVALSTYAAFLVIFTPEVYVSTYTSTSLNIQGMTLELIRWYGDSLLPLAILEFAALFKKNDVFLSWLFKAFLVGDTLRIVLVFRYMLLNPTEQWTGGYVFSIIVVILLVVARLCWLFYYRSTNRNNP